MFLLIALEKWVGHLAEESAVEVPTAALAVEAMQRRAGEHQAEHSSGVTDVHPLALLQHLSGGEPAVRSILQAKHKGKELDFESKIMSLCCGNLDAENQSGGPSRPNLLDKATENQAGLFFELMICLQHAHICEVTSH